MKTPEYIQERFVYKKKAEKYAETFDEPEYIKKKIEQCEDCGKHCETRSVFLEWCGDIKAWNSSCSVCTRYLDPRNNEYHLTRQAARAIIKTQQKKRDK